MTTAQVGEPLRILVVDDEDLARQRILSLLARRSDFEVIGECATGTEAVRSIRELKPDIVLLDVQMPELDGFDVISEIGAQNMPVVVLPAADHRPSHFGIVAYVWRVPPLCRR